MLRHCVVGVPLTRCYIGSSYMTIAQSARTLIQRPCLPATGRAVLSPLSQSLPWRCINYRPFSEKHCFPAVSRVVSSSLCQPMPWCRTSERQKNVYYGFASSKPKPLSRYGVFYHIFLTVGICSIVLTPL